MGTAPTDRVSDHYRGASGADYFALQQSHANVKAALGERRFSPYLRPDDSLVEFGAAGGQLLQRLTRKKLVRDAVGIDANRRNREVAAQIGVRVVELADELDAGQADVVISSHTLEHTLAPLTELQLLRRLLKPGGRLVLVVPVDDWRTQRTYEPTDVNHHLYTWTPLLLGHLLAEAGFTVRECRLLHYGLPGRLTYPLARTLPPSAFHIVTRATALLLRRRELLAVASN